MSDADGDDAISDGGFAGASDCPSASLPSCAETLHDLAAFELASRPDVTLDFSIGASYPSFVTEDVAALETTRTSVVTETGTAAAATVPAVAETNSAVAEPRSVVEDHAGTIGILCGNWGGNKAECGLNDHMQYDIKSGPCTFIMLQEATEQTLLNLRAPGAPGVEEEGPSRGGGGKRYLKRQSFQYLGLRGLHKIDVMIAARVSHVESMRMLFYRSRHDGQFRVAQRKWKTKKAAKKRIAVTTWAIAACRMRHFALPAVAGASGDGPDAVPTKTLTMMSIHMHHATCKKEVAAGATSLALLWDEVVESVMKFEVRILGGDFNMALWLVAPELRARGLDVNLAAWYPWQKIGASTPTIDSCAIFLIGPSAGIRTVYNAASIIADAEEETDRPKEWQNVEQVVHDADGKVVRRQPFPLSLCEFGAGEVLTNYRPKDAAKIKEFVRWSCGASVEMTSPAMAGPRLASEKVGRQGGQLVVMSGPKGRSKGAPSWDWRPLPPCSQKLVEMEKFDPSRALFPRGAHMPIMTFLGTCSRRTPAARARRAKRADERGWNYERRHAGQSPTRGGGGPEASGKGKGKRWTGGLEENSQGQPAASSGSHGGGGGDTRNGGGREGSHPQWRGRADEGHTRNAGGHTRNAAAAWRAGEGHTRNGGGREGWSSHSWNTRDGGGWRAL